MASAAAVAEETLTPEPILMVDNMPVVVPPLAQVLLEMQELLELQIRVLAVVERLVLTIQAPYLAAMAVPVL
jgi:hypothetical protein